MPIEMLEAGVADVPEDQEPRRRGSARRWVAVLVLASIVTALGARAWDVVRGAGPIGPPVLQRVTPEPTDG